MKKSFLLDWLVDTMLSHRRIAHHGPFSWIQMPWISPNIPRNLIPTLSTAQFHKEIWTGTPQGWAPLACRSRRPSSFAGLRNFVQFQPLGYLQRSHQGWVPNHSGLPLGWMVHWGRHGLVSFSDGCCHFIVWRFWQCYYGPESTLQEGSQNINEVSYRHTIILIFSSYRLMHLLVGTPRTTNYSGMPLAIHFN